MASLWDNVNHNPQSSATNTAAGASGIVDRKTSTSHLRVAVRGKRGDRFCWGNLTASARRGIAAQRKAQEYQIASFSALHGSQQFVFQPCRMQYFNISVRLISIGTCVLPLPVGGCLKRSKLFTTCGHLGTVLAMMTT